MYCSGSGKEKNGEDGETGKDGEVGESGKDGEDGEEFSTSGFYELPELRGDSNDVCSVCPMDRYFGKWKDIVR